MKTKKTAKKTTVKGRKTAVKAKTTGRKTVVKAKAKTTARKTSKKPVPRGTAVIQMTPRGRRIRKYPSINAASEATGINSGSISYVVRDMRNTAGGFKWSMA
jgi:hypothetical protein